MKYNDVYIIKMLENGSTRKEIAIRLGLKSYQSIHRYMLKNGYIWDELLKNYEKVNTTIMDIPTRIINLLHKNDSIELIAKKLHFESTKVMHSYMLKEGYQWNSEIKNFEKNNSYPENDIMDKRNVKNSDNIEMQVSLDFLISKIDVLKKVIQDYENEPSYFSSRQLKGDTRSKSIQLNIELNEIMLNFCEKFGLSQKDLINTAIVDTLLRYGYRDKLKNILQ